MVLTLDHGKQLLIEVLIAVIGFLTDDTVTWYVGFLCQIPEHVCELHSGIIHVKAHVKSGFFGSLQQSFLNMSANFIPASSMSKPM